MRQAKAIRASVGAVLAGFALAVGAASPAAAQGLGGPLGCLALAPGDEDPPNAWMGTEARVWKGHIPGRTGACLQAKVFAPPAGRYAGPRPAVVMTGGTAAGDAAMWASHYLANRGYVVLQVTPQGQGRSELFSPDLCDFAITLDRSHTEWCRGYPPILNVDNFVDAFRSGVDFLQSPAYLDSYTDPSPVDPGRVGAAGHSMGARGASHAQDEDTRIRAIVAWDNLVSDKQGDEGLAMGGGPTAATQAGQVPGRSFPVVPRAPAMGHASDGPGLTNVNPGPWIKKTAYEVWREAGVPSFELVLRGAGHGAWGSGTSAEGSAGDRNHQIILYFTKAWFDRFLLEGLPADHPEPADAAAHESAVHRLTSTLTLGAIDAPELPDADGMPKEEYLSADYDSALFLPDEEEECGNLLAEDCVARQPPDLSKCENGAREDGRISGEWHRTVEPAAGGALQEELHKFNCDVNGITG